ncbi:MBOAT family O-acyltransferase [Solitalea canadensis]|nr:MBOAT family O-acyltransferase [Solitalea canadensis]
MVYIIGILLNVGILIYYKYTNFFIDNFNFLSAISGSKVHFNLVSILLPVGLSFMTFQSISYLIEIKRGNLSPEKNIITLANYFLFFPKILAGPIERPGPFLEQLKSKIQINPTLIEEGLKLCLIGFFKKLVVGDRLAIYVNKVYDAPETFGSGALIVATIFFTIQLYCDFSGYCDIGMGVSKMMGLRLTKNFNHPLFAVSFSDFWKRWHITLSSWLRDYIFIPLCGRRAKRTKIYSAIFLVFLISGFWHGANWTFIVWGMMHGTFIILGDIKDRLWNKYVTIDIPEKLLYVGSVCITFLLVSFTRIFFKSDTIGEALMIIKRILTIPGPVELDIVGKYLLLAVTALLLVYEFKKEFFKNKFSISGQANVVINSAYMASLLVLIVLLGVFNQSGFIYMKF